MRLPDPAPFAVGLLAFTLCACGGGHPQSPRSASGVPPQERDADDQVASAAAEKNPPPASAPSCADEGCFACGAGFCLRGFYCDEDTTGGAACSWVPDCPKGATCDCLKRSMGGCSCETANGGAHVRCQ